MAGIQAGAKTSEAPLPNAQASVRLDSIDLLRGLAVVVMALDHTRDFIGASGQNPRDIAAPRCS
ncbi:hypothetical protein [Falsiroseomonas sp. HW251]|uniref:hypothetical protein n=1 Tax=Falsiroseomonas sp. HW251 TaxID=3390998 RepID=UPI003D31E9F9